ncbi:hypothetical protein R69746_07741 [Paraburkholderia aspalathi]|uniref:hypothetical protein n=1 Tax=Paraburkholderia aspalathi TaxID=1324617 RepID=UPI001909D9C7|nr:hypothetical protein [Paraburkholderia aspalathi]MBK3843726.1 hypothetical protein [Paraburkholderia aspalathi]CAE6859492.1 hypothetical protein R69746_07741 [Paraburkholderia aspalathi]
MKAIDVRAWAFEPRVADDSEVECRECGAWSPLSEWTEVHDGIECETCGEHDAIECPGCGELYDHVHSSHSPLRTRNPAIQFVDPCEAVLTDTGSALDSIGALDGVKLARDGVEPDADYRLRLIAKLRVKTEAPRDTSLRDAIRATP